MKTGTNPPVPAGMNADVFCVLSPAFRSENAPPYFTDIGQMRHGDLFKAARATAASKGSILAHPGSGPEYIDLLHACALTPYTFSMFDKDAYAPERDAIGLRLQVRHNRAITRGLIEICYTMKPRPLEVPDPPVNPIFPDAVPWVPRIAGWSLHIDDDDYRGWLQIGQLTADALIRSFVAQVFPGQGFGIGDHDLNALLIGDADPLAPEAANHQSVIATIERIVEWFLAIHEPIMTAR